MYPICNIVKRGGTVNSIFQAISKNSYLSNKSSAALKASLREVKLCPVLEKCYFPVFPYFPENFCYFPGIFIFLIFLSKEFPERSSLFWYFARWSICCFFSFTYTGGLRWSKMGYIPFLNMFVISWAHMNYAWLAHRELSENSKSGRLKTWNTISLGVTLPQAIGTELIRTATAFQSDWLLLLHMHRGTLHFHHIIQILKVFCISL